MSIDYIRVNWNVSWQQEILSAAELVFGNTSHCLQKNRVVGGSPWSWGKAHLTSEAFLPLSDLRAVLSSCYSQSSYKNVLKTPDEVNGEQCPPQGLHREHPGAALQNIPHGLSSEHWLQQSFVMDWEGCEAPL